MVNTLLLIAVLWVQKYKAPKVVPSNNALVSMADGYGFDNKL